MIKNKIPIGRIVILLTLFSFFGALFLNWKLGFIQFDKDGETHLGSYSREPANVTRRAILPQYSFSKDFVPPSSKQGVSEARVMMSPLDFDQRYLKLKQMGAAYRQYNVFWTHLEASNIPSSSEPIACPPDHHLVPSNTQELVALGYHRFRCINSKNLDVLDNLLRRDQQMGMQSGVVMWYSPPIYRYPGCEGFIVSGEHLAGGCVPRDDAMDDFEDYVNLLASRYNGGEHGKISHFIVWNENASADWFDYTPVIRRTDMSPEAVNKRIDKYADMLKRTHNALMRHQRAALMYVSVDQIIENGVYPTHYGNLALMEGLWSRLGIRYSWSLAVHPYGPVDQPAPPSRYTFNNLELVAQYQKNKLKELGVQNVEAYPQSILIASEQGWPLTFYNGQVDPRSRLEQARQVCLAHEKVMSMPEVIAVAHNYFHSVEEADENPNALSIQGAFFGLIPYSISNNLDNLLTLPIGKAFASTMNPQNWRQNNNHYCCQMYGLGCFQLKSRNNSKVSVPPLYSSSISSSPSVAQAYNVMGYVDGYNYFPNGSLYLGGWACMRGVNSSISVSVYVGGRKDSGGQLIGIYSANKTSEPEVGRMCAASGVAYRFQIPITQAMIQAYHNQPVFVYGQSSLGFGDVELIKNPTMSN